jgi:hypothetical protein
MLGRGVDKKWVEWAYDMLSAGFETESLVILAGELEPYNQFELNALTDNVFKELNLTWNDREQVLKNYACYLVSEALDGKMKILNVLDILKDIYIDLDYDPPLNGFYLLYYAWDDLRYSDKQWYWDGATRENIDSVVMGYFAEWKRNCD